MVKSIVIVVVLLSTFVFSTHAPADEIELTVLGNRSSLTGSVAGLGGLLGGSSPGAGIRYGFGLWEGGILSIGIDGWMSEQETDTVELNQAQIGLPLELKLALSEVRQQAVVPTLRMGVEGSVGRVSAHNEDYAWTTFGVGFRALGGVQCMLAEHFGLQLEAGLAYSHTWIDEPEHSISSSTSSSLSIIARGNFVIPFDPVPLAGAGPSEGP